MALEELAKATRKPRLEWAIEHGPAGQYFLRNLGPEAASGLRIVNSKELRNWSGEIGLLPKQCAVFALASDMVDELPSTGALQVFCHEIGEVAVPIPPSM